MPMTVETDDYSSIKRKLIFRDALTFLSLVLVTIVLLLMTLFLFRSFASHRDDLAKRWSARGQAALSSGRPDQAIVALRTALSYAPGERSYELLLAQALGAANHTEESYNYFLSLWETQPGDGFINLNLARLAAKKNETQTAVNYYRAAIFGTWEGDGTVRRREVRLELAHYLIAHHEPGEARTELLIAGSNDLNDPAVDLTLAPLLEAVGDSSDALKSYDKVLAQEPDDRAALTGAGRLQYLAGNYEEAHRLLQRAFSAREAAGGSQTASSPEAKTMLDNSARIVALAPSRRLPSGERVDRILKAREIAKARLSSCSATVSSSGSTGSALQGLTAAWAGKEGMIGRRALLRNSSEQENVMKLVFDTETEAQAGGSCGAPTGDDALLLLLAKSSRAMEPIR